MAYQHIRIKNSNVAGKVPTAAQIDVAELCVNLQDHKLYSKDADGNIFELTAGGAQVPGGGTPPSSGNEIGDLFFDTVNQQLLYWDGNQWVPIAGDEVQNLDDLQDVVITDPESGQALIWNGTSWVNADLSDQIFNPGTNPPSNPELGDIWIDTSECPPVLNIYSDCDGTAGWQPISGGRPQPIYPSPDEITSNPGFQGGTGTQGDPYILQPIDVRPAGASGQSVELIRINVIGAQGGQPVEFTDLSTGAGSRFAQPTGVTEANGSWSGRLVYNDIPATTTEGTEYTGDLQIGEVYFRWVVTQGVEAVRPIDPSPDEITSNPGFQGGSGTNGDPYILKPITVSPAGSNGQTVETITIAEVGAGAGETVRWTNNSVGSGTRFDQPNGVTGADGSWSGRLVYNDTPNTTSDQIYTGNLQIGTTYFRWVVTQLVHTPIVFTPTISGSNKVGDTLTANTGAISGGTSPEVKSYQWKRNGGDIAGATAQTYVLVSADIGTTISCAVTVAEPNGDNATTEVAIYNQTPEVDATINQPSILSPPDGAGIGGDVTYTPKTSAITSVQGNLITVQNSNTYDADTGENHGQTISETFLTGDTVYAAQDATITGTLVANASGNTLDIVGGTQLNFVLTNNTAANNWQGLAYGNGVWVAVSLNGSMRAQRSTDNGETWTTTGIGFANNTSWSGLAFGNGKFVAVAGQSGQGKWVMYSSDGATWSSTGVTGQGLGPSTPSPNLVFSNGKFFRQHGSNVLSSSDGLAWSLHTTAPADIVNMASSGNKIACFFSTSSNMFYSDDGGTSFRTVNLGFSTYWYSMTSNGNILVVGGDGKLIYSTDNGVTWNDAQGLNAVNFRFTCLAYANGVFVGNSNKGDPRIQISFDGINWKPQDNAPSNNWKYLKYGNNRFVGIAYNAGPNGAYYFDFGGSNFTEGMEIVKNGQVTSTGPGANTLEFVGSIPSGTNINTWGVAQWEVSANNFATTMTDTKAITNASSTQTLAVSDRSNINLAPDTTYKVRLKYTSSNPAIESLYANSRNFKTASTTRQLFPDTYYDTEAQEPISGDDLSLRYGIDPGTADLSQFGIAELTEQPDYPVLAYVPEGDKYQPIEDQGPRIEELETSLANAQQLVSDVSARLTALEEELQ